MKIVVLLLAMIFAVTFAFKKVTDDVKRIAAQQELKQYAAHPTTPDVVKVAAAHS